jgi:hypothetical protein
VNQAPDAIVRRMRASVTTIRPWPGAAVGLVALMMATALGRLGELFGALKQQWELDFGLGGNVLYLGFATAGLAYCGVCLGLLLTSVTPRLIRLTLGLLSLCAALLPLGLLESAFGGNDVPGVLLVPMVGGAVVAVAVVLRAVAAGAWRGSARLSTVVSLAAVPAAAVVWYGAGLAELSLTNGSDEVQENWAGQEVKPHALAFASPHALALIGSAIVVVAGCAYGALLSRRLPTAVPVSVGIA